MGIPTWGDRGGLIDIHFIVAHCHCLRVSVSQDVRGRAPGEFRQRCLRRKTQVLAKAATRKRSCDKALGWLLNLSLTAFAFEGWLNKGTIPFL
jgi:hypothetical protein